MQTAIIVYQSTCVNITTYESGLQMYSLDNQTVNLASGSNERNVSPGIYKIVSSQNVQVTGDTSIVDTVSTNTKSDVPTLPAKATQSFPPLNAQTWNAFFAVPDAKGGLSL
jgi:hypothetical protein